MATVSKDQGVTAVVETSSGAMTLEFFPDKAPGHVANFIKLAEKGFYDGTVFHRVIKGFMIQGGCPEGTGRGGPGYKIKAEFNDVRHTPGILSMARISASSLMSAPATKALSPAPVTITPRTSSSTSKRSSA